MRGAVLPDSIVEFEFDIPCEGAWPLHLDIQPI